jgi:hypothetical protein
MSVQGKYVPTFAEASHALLDGMHMNADYPFMIPKVKGVNGGYVVLADRMVDGRFKIVKSKDGREHCVVAQKSTFENLYRKPPKKFKAYPFKDENTPSVAQGVHDD